MEVFFFFFFHFNESDRQADFTIIRCLESGNRQLSPLAFSMIAFYFQRQDHQSAFIFPGDVVPGFRQNGMVKARFMANQSHCQPSL